MQEMSFPSISGNVSGDKTTVKTADQSELWNKHMMKHVAVCVGRQ
jgi:hypothetical protein